MNQISNYRFAGLSGLLSGILYILSIIGLQSYISADLENVSAFTRNMMDSPTMMLLYGWPGLLATLLIIPVLILLSQNERGNNFLNRSVFLITAIGLSFILVGYLFHLALNYFYAPAFQALDRTQQSIFAIVFKTTIGLQDMFWLLGDLFAFLGIGALMILHSKKDLFPNWLMIFGTTASGLAALGSISFIPAFKSVPGLSILFIMGFALFTLWEMVAGVILLRYKIQISAT